MAATSPTVSMEVMQKMMHLQAQAVDEVSGRGSTAGRAGPRSGTAAAAAAGARQACAAAPHSQGQDGGYVQPKLD